MPYLRSAALLFLFIFFSGTNMGLLRAQNACSSKTVKNLPDNVSIHQLDNGLQILLIENPALPMIGVNVVVKVGSAYETFATSGMSHMLEHLLFNGTTTRTQKQLYDDVDRIGGYNNANTSEYYTNFMMVVPAENIRQGMEIQADMLFHSTLPQNKFSKEKGIVLEEISKSLANPREQVERNVISVLFKGHALSLPTLGTYSTIEHMGRDQVFEFYKNNYVPNNMRMSVIGNFNSAQMLEMIKQIYGNEAPGTVRRPELTGWSYGFDRSHLQAPQPGQVFHRFYDGKDALLQCFFYLQGRYSPAFYELADIKLARLAGRLQENSGGQVKAVRLEMRQTPLANYIQATIKLKSPQVDYAPFVSRLRRELRTIKNFYFKKEVVEAEAAKARTSFLKNIEKPHMFGIFNAHDIAVRGFEAVLNSYSGEDYLPAARQMRSFKTLGQPIVVLQMPLKKKRAAVEKTLSPAKLFVNKQNGLTLIARQNAASNLLAIHYLFKHKASLEAEFGKDAAKILHDCFGQRLRTPEKQKISNRFGLSLKVNDNPYLPMDDIYMNPDFGYIRVEGLADDIAGIIDYLNAQMNGFLPTPQEFQKAQAKFSRGNSMMMGGDPAKKLFQKIYAQYVYEKASVARASQKLTYEKLLAFTREYFQAGNAIVSVVSKAAPDSIAHLFNKLKGRPASGQPQPFERTIRLHDQTLAIDTLGGGKRAYLFWGFSKNIDEQDKPALKVLSLILADKIIFDIREKQGMAYHLSAGIRLVKERALFYIEQGTRPENVDILLPQYPAFFDRKMLSEVGADDLQKSVNMYLGRMMFRRLSSINQAYYLATSLYFHNDIEYDQKFLDALKNVTLQDVRKAAKKYMIVQNPVKIVVR